MPPETDPTAAVARALGHGFARAELLAEALTHRSYSNEHPDEHAPDNERLELLGDSVVGFVVCALLFERFPDAREGELTQRRADLVCEASLTEIAREVDVGAALRLGRGEERTGGRDKPRLLASALEACLGAVYLDAGFDAAMRIARPLFEVRIEGLPPGARDFKSRVQTILQARGEGNPRYVVLAADGPDHDRSFHVALHAGEARLGEGRGRTKVQAEQAAAQQTLRLLDADTPDAGPEAST